MAKKQDLHVKVLQLVRENGGYGFIEYQIPIDVLKNQGKVISKSEPDIYAILVNEITKKTREIFEI